MSEFTEWLNQEIADRGWTMRELSRRSKISSGALSMIMSEQRRAGTDVCRRIAHALRVPPEVVFRKAGLLPALPQHEHKEREMLIYFRYLDDRQQDDLLTQVRALHEAQSSYNRAGSMESVHSESESIHNGRESCPT